MDWYKDKRIVLTGATSGIGRRLLDCLIESGARVVAVGRHIHELPVHSQIIPFCCDVSKKERMDALFEFSLHELGDIDLFFANAGFGYCEKLDTPDWEHLDSIFRTNVYAPIYGLEKMLSHYPTREFSYIVTISGVAQTPLAGFSLYTSTKFAVDGFVQAMRLELSSNVHLTAVYPMALKTAFFSRSGKNAPLPPLFQQSVETTVHAMLKGVAAHKRSIRPMPLFNLCIYLMHLFPFLGRQALKVSVPNFNEWLKNKQKEDLTQ